MPAKRCCIQTEFQPLAIPHNDRIKRLARASAILAQGQARRREQTRAQSKVAFSKEFIHNPPSLQTKTTIP